jgi:hypothetical protein
MLRIRTTSLGETFPLSILALRSKAPALIRSAASVDSAIPRGDDEGQEPCSDVEVRRPCEPEVFERHDSSRRSFEEGLREGITCGFHGLLKNPAL